MVTLYNKAREVAASDEREVDSDLGGGLEDLGPIQDNFLTPVAPVNILYRAALVNIFRLDFADILLFTIQVFLPYITSQLQHMSRLAVWDKRLADGLKAEARTRRGKCIRRRVSLHWQQLDSFFILVASAASVATYIQVVSTYHTDVPRHIEGLAPCTHEEADTQILHPPGRCCETRVWQDTHSHSGHGCGSYCCDISPAPQHRRTVDCTWCSEQLP